MNTTTNETTDSLNEDIFFTPSNFERDDPSLIKLFNGVETLISDFMNDESRTLKYDEDKIRRYIAGHVCHETLDEIRGKLVALTSEKRVFPWNIYVREQFGLYNASHEEKAAGFNNKELMATIKQGYEAIMEGNSEEKAYLVAQAKFESQDIKKVPMNIKHKRFADDWKIMQKNMQYFYENYRTHIITVCATDTKFDAFYRARVNLNSGISIHHMEAIRLHSFSYLYTQRSRTTHWILYRMR